MCQFLYILYFVNFLIYFNIFNNRITQSDESGIYEHEVRKSLKTKGFGPDINTKVDVNVYEFQALSLKQMKGVFMILIVGHILAFVVFVMEVFIHKYMDIICYYITDISANSRIISYFLEIYYFYFNRNNS